MVQYGGVSSGNEIDASKPSCVLTPTKDEAPTSLTRGSFALTLPMRRWIRGFDRDRALGATRLGLVEEPASSDRDCGGTQPRSAPNTTSRPTR
jgi:hypothetical protein